MRVLKQDKYKSILDAARDEFTGNGYKDASMRSIAKKAHVGLSNIYNYFENKDKIFLAVVQPGIDALHNYMEDNHTEDDVHFDIIASKRYREETTDKFIQIIFSYKTEIRLLLYSSDGSSVSSFRDAFLDFTTKIGKNYLCSMKRHYPQANISVSDFFIRVNASWIISIIGELVTQDIKRYKAKEFFDDYFRFTTAGWRELIEI